MSAFYGSQEKIDSLQVIMVKKANEQGYYDFVSPKFIKELLEEEIAIHP